MPKGSHFLRHTFLTNKTVTLDHTSSDQGSHFSCRTFWSKIYINDIDLWMFGLSTVPYLSSKDKGSHFLCHTSFLNISINVWSELLLCLLDYTCLCPNKGSHFSCPTFLSKIHINIELWRFGLSTGPCLSSPPLLVASASGTNTRGCGVVLAL